MSPDRMTDHSHLDKIPPDSVEPGIAPRPDTVPTAAGSDIIPYAAPMFAYVALGGLESYLPVEGGQPSPLWYPLAYGVRVVLVAALCWWYRATWSDFRPWPKAPALILAVLVGLVVWGLWVGLDGHYPALPFLGKRGGFDFETLAPQLAPGVHRGENAGTGDSRPARRRALLAVISDPLADRPRFSQGARSVV